MAYQTEVKLPPPSTYTPSTYATSTYLSPTPHVHRSKPKKHVSHPPVLMLLLAVRQGTSQQ